jgi:tetratricopeptide (TPR) repeat protein
MTYVRRLRAVGAVLALAAVVTNAHVWGDSQKSAKDNLRSAAQSPAADVAEDLTPSKFTNGDAISYRTSAGETLFALQIKPRLDALPAKPLDLLVMIDTSASQARGPLASAIKIAETLANAAGEQDRVSIWTVNIPAATVDLTRGFKPAKSQGLSDGLAKLQDEYPSGDTDLKNALTKASESFDAGANRRRAIVFLGDGMSIHNPLAAAERSKVAAALVAKEIGFVGVPLGPRVDGVTLNSLAAGTGGSVISLASGDKITELARDISASLATPVLYPTSRFEVAGGAAEEVFPTTLPPLRGDAATLVIGKLKSGNSISYSIQGRLGDQAVKIEKTEHVDSPEMDNFFLVGAFEQWKNGKDQPALIRADKALAYAYQQSQVVRADLHTKAEWAMSKDNWEAAKELFEQAKKLDPADLEADSSLKLIEQLRTGAIKRESIRDESSKQKAYMMQLLAKRQNQQPPTPAPVAGQPQPPVPVPTTDDLIQEQKRRIAVEEQRIGEIVNDSIRQAVRILYDDPDAAHDILKRTYATVRDNPDLGDRVRQSLLDSVEGALRDVDLKAGRIKLEQDERLKVIALGQTRLDIDIARMVEEERTRRRFQQFSNLMAQARFEEAYAQSLAIIKDAVASGRRVPPAAIAAYEIGINSNNLSQFKEVRRLTEDYWMRAMMQVELAHIPFPDDSPIKFPSEEKWREISLRKAKYENGGLTDDDPETLRKIRIMKAKLDKPVVLDKGLEKMTFGDAKQYFEDRFDITILVNEAAFKAIESDVPNVNEAQVKLDKMSGVSLATVLRLLTAQFGGTYIIRRDYIEITTPRAAASEKVVRVYPVADLVIPIPNAVNVQQVSQQLTILGTSPGIGLQLGSPAALGGLGALGVGGVGINGLGGALGALGIGGLGGLGGLGIGGIGGGGALGAAGFQGFPGNGGLGAAGNQPQNLGVGGGALGFGGGQLGQFGNLGGQFGLQGGNQSAVLVQLIRDTVGNPREWARPGTFQRPPSAANNPAGPDGNDEDTDPFPPELQNSLGYYPPARALVVKGTSRLHTNLGNEPAVGKGPNMVLNDRARGNEAIVNNESKKVLDKAKQIAGSSDNQAAQVAAAKPAGDPKKIWQEALEQGVNDPHLIVGVVDVLTRKQKFDHAAEFLKANLRQGVVVRPWVYDALALSLEASKGSLADIERARVSAVDLEPQDAQGYLRASKTMAEHKMYDRALAFCRQAAILEPGIAGAYEDALVYADQTKDVSSMEWAARNLLRRDWPTANQDLHSKAQAKLKELLANLQQDSRRGEAERMVKNVLKSQQRDLVIRLIWQGEADLDLEIKEPVGTVCSFQQRQSPGGGVLLGDRIGDAPQESYVAAKAFRGDYQITVRRVWGHILGSKAVLEIIEHQGTPEETHRRDTIVFDRIHMTSFTLDKGSRTAAEYVPPAPATSVAKKAAAVPSGTDVLNDLRALANGDHSHLDSSMKGTTVAAGNPVSTVPVARAEGGLMYQTKLAPVAQTGVDVIAQVSMDASGNSMHVKLSPVFQGVQANAAKVGMNNPIIPGVFEQDQQ